ncbi:MAG: transglycosylase [Proteobacteria bacterium]|nr:transglycosylase [Pseudomonadota bacterium]
MHRFSRLFLVGAFGLYQACAHADVPSDRAGLPGGALNQKHAIRWPKPAANRVDLNHTLWARVAMERALDPHLLYAVALVESARVSGDSAAPWPWALNHDGKTLYADSPEAAIHQVRNSLSAGKWAIDVGLMQVNLRWHRHRVHRAEDLVDPLTNLQVGADILAESIASAPGDLALGVGRYHAWNDRVAAYRYGRKVLALAERLQRAPTW